MSVSVFCKGEVDLGPFEDYFEDTASEEVKKAYADGHAVQFSDESGWSVMPRKLEV